MNLRRDLKSISVNLLALGALVLGLLISIPAHAQVAGATLSGTVTDPSGAVIPNTQLSIRNTATGVVRGISTDSAGFYAVPNLLPGTYQVTVSASGFKTVVRSGITLTVGAEQSLNLIMQVGDMAEKVEVTAGAPAVQLASSSMTAVITSHTVVELPLNGRDWAQLAMLQPAVNLVQTQFGGTGGSGQRGYGSELAISGTRPQMNNYRLDGISIVGHSGGGPNSMLGATLGVDAIGEFSVSTSNYTAEYGRTSGGVINAITKSGTNTLHGDVYWFLRDEDFDAATFIDNAAGRKIPPFHRNQFGVSAGGPIEKGKTFFFANYEGLRQALGTTNLSNVPSPDARNGIIHNADGTTCTIGIVTPGCSLQNSAGTIGVDPKVKPFLAFYPPPNAGLVSPGNVGLFATATNTNQRENFVTARIDRRLSDRDNLYVTWFYDKEYSDAPDPLLILLNVNREVRHMEMVEWTHTFRQSLVNSVRAGYHREQAISTDPAAAKALNPLAVDTSGTVSALPGRPAANVRPMGGLAAIIGGPGNDWNDQVFNSIQFYDDAFLTKGKHSLKFGFALENMQHSPQNVSSQNATFDFSGLTSFLINTPVRLSVIGRPGFTAADFRPQLRQTLLGGYVQDDWRLHPNLTLNLGLRYEMATVPMETHNKLSNMRSLTDPAPALGNPYFQNPTLRNFEPRIGLAWDPFGTGKTAVRGAFGFFDPLPLTGDFHTAACCMAPYASTNVVGAAALHQGDFPGVAATIRNAGLSSTYKYQYFQFNPSRNYVMVWNLNVQRELTPTLMAMVGYVGNHGVHMLDRVDDANYPPLVSRAHGLLWPCGPPLDKNGNCTTGQGVQIAAPAITGGIAMGWWGGSAVYDALQATVTKKFSRGFQAQGSFTWSKAIDSGSASVIANPYMNTIGSMPWDCGACRRGLSDFNVGRALVISYVWEIPTPKSWGSGGSMLLGGWQLGGIFTASDGVPLTPYIGGDPLGLRDSSVFDFPNRIAGCDPINHNFKKSPSGRPIYVNTSCYVLPAATPEIAAQCAPFGSPNAPIAGTCANLMGNAGRNTLIGPGYENFDFSLIKNNRIKKISESFNAQFRVELFNVLNRANFGVPTNNKTFFDVNGNRVANGGLLDTTLPARQIQFGLKLLW